MSIHHVLADVKMHHHSGGNLQRAFTVINSHWPVLFAIILIAWLLSPLVINMGALTDDHLIIHMVRTGHSFIENFCLQLKGNARPLEGIGLQLEYRLYDWNNQVGQVYALLLHLVNGLLLYVLLIKLKLDRWLATAIVILRLTAPLQSEAIFWFASRQYLTSSIFMLIALLIFFNTSWKLHTSGLVSCILLLCSIMLMEQVGPMAFMLGIGLWWGWIINEKIQRGKLYYWFSGTLIGSFIYLICHHLAATTRTPVLKDPFTMLRGSIGRWIGDTSILSGFEFIQDNLWVLLPTLGLVVIISLAGMRGKLPEISQVWRIMVLCILGIIGAIGPVLLVGWVPGRTFYHPAVWCSITIVLLLIYLFRKYAWILLTVVLVFSLVSLLGNASYFIDANRIQQKYMESFQRALPLLPDDTQRIVAVNIPVETGNVQMFDDTWSLGAALMNLYEITDRTLEVWTMNDDCPWPPETVTLTAIWDPVKQQVEIKKGYAVEK